MVKPLPDFRLYAICGTFAEEDIIEATVKNAFVQGCERFYLVDHSSPDETVVRALKAGAELAATIPTAEVGEKARTNALNRCMTELSDAHPGSPIWWLHLDADEFPKGPRGMTVREYLAGLDHRYRIVGSVFYNHYPTGQPANMRGIHPIEFQPLCERELFSYCGSGHYKHPLLRYDFDVPNPLIGEGLHRPRKVEAQEWREPREGLITHHFQFREERQTRRRIELTIERNPRPRPVTRRREYLDAVYEGDWENALLRRTRLGDRPVQLRHWRDLLRLEDQVVHRWYTLDELEPHDRG